MFEICKHKIKGKQIIFLGMLSLIILSPEISHATTVLASVPGQAELGGVYNNLKGLVTGAVGKIIGITSLIVGMIGAVVGANIKFLLPTGGIALAVGAGPSVVESLMGAIF